MRVTESVTWAGNCTDRFDETVAFFRDVMGLELAKSGEPAVDTQYTRYAVFQLPGDFRFEVFEPKPETRDRFTGPVLAFTVDDIDAACRELEAKGVAFVTPLIDDGAVWRWRYFRGPDGNVYLVQQRYAA